MATIKTNRTNMIVIVQRSTLINGIEKEINDLFVVWLVVDSEHKDTGNVDKDAATHHEEDIDGQQ